MARTPTLEDVTTGDIQKFGGIIKQLSVGDRVKATNHYLARYVEGTVVEATNPEDGVHIVIMEDEDGTRFELYANWRDIPVDSDDQDTPYTGLLEEPFDDTSPPVTDIQVLS